MLNALGRFKEQCLNLEDSINSNAGIQGLQGSCWMYWNPGELGLHFRANSWLEGNALRGSTAARDPGGVVAPSPGNADAGCEASAPERDKRAAGQVAPGALAHTPK